MKLGEICSRITDGKHGDCKDKQNSGYYFLSAKDIFEKRLNYEKAREIEENDFFETHKRTNLQPGDLLLTNSGTIGRVAIATDDPKTYRTTFQKSVAILKPILTIVDPLFLYYVLLSERLQIQEMAGGTTQQNLLLRDIKKIDISLPPLPEQRAIAAILGALDDKIELNHRMNCTLEEMARAIFQERFINYEQSKKWELVDLGSFLSEIVSGARPKGGAITEGIPSIGAENIISIGIYDYSKEKYIPIDFFNELKNKSADVRPGDVLIYKDGAQIGRKTFFDCGFPHKICAINEHVFILRSKYQFAQRYLFFWLDQDWMTKELINLNSNSAQPGINKNSISQLKILLPSEKYIHEFDDLIAPITNKIFSNAIESRTLANIRDTLLPKIVSGRISIK